MNLEIVDMTEMHLAGAAKIFNHYVATSTATFHTAPLSIKEMTDEILCNQSGCAALALIDPENSTVHGYGALMPFKGRCAYAYTREISVFLSPEATSRGWGERIIHRLEEFATKNGIHCLIAVICEENDSSQKLFTRLNYTCCGSLKEVGFKFARWLGIQYWQKPLDIPEKNDAK